MELELADVSLRGDARERADDARRARGARRGRARARGSTPEEISDPGRRAEAPPGRLQPAVERGQVHAGGRPRRRRRAAERRTSSRSPSADTGPGIAPEDQELIFEEFRQARGGVGRHAEGTGLGLPLARKFVELHGGRLWVESVLGAGQHVPLHAAPRAGRVSAHGGRARPDRRRQREEHAARAGRAALRGASRRSRRRAAPRASRVAVEHRPDVILMDIRLPDMDGTEATRAAQGRPADRRGSRSSRSPRSR